MPLLLARTYDQALLAMVVDEARKIADHEDGYVGRTALQKILYFLKVSGVPMGYRFEIHNFGPFCDEILSDSDVLIADEVIADRSNNPERYSNYAPGTAAAELAALHGTELEKVRAHVKDVVRALVPLSPGRLEILATLDYSYRWVKASGGAGPWKDRAVAKFIEFKKTKFQKTEIESTYDQMAAAGLVEL